MSNNFFKETPSPSLTTTLQTTTVSSKAPPPIYPCLPILNLFIFLIYKKARNVTFFFCHPLLQFIYIVSQLILAYRWQAFLSFFINSLHKWIFFNITFLFSLASIIPFSFLTTFFFLFVNFTSTLPPSVACDEEKYTLSSSLHKWVEEGVRIKAGGGGGLLG